MKNIIISHISENKKKYLLLIFIFVIGVILGFIFLRVLPKKNSEELLKFLDDTFNSILSSEKSFDSLAYFYSSMLEDLKLYLCLYILGFSYLGMIFSPMFILVKGFVLGFTNFFIMTSYNSKGLLYNFLALVPQNLISLIPFLLLCVIIISFQSKIFMRRDTIGYTSEKSSYYLIYSVMVLISFMLNLACLAFESFITPKLVFLLTQNMV